MSNAFHFDKQTAVRVAELLEQDGKLKEAANVWWELGALNPYDRHPREKFAELAYDVQQSAVAPGSVARSRLILRVIRVSIPTPRLASAYFDNLRQLLQARPERRQPGTVILGIGSGRCASTTLSAAVAALPDACATHENPPLLFWAPLEEQVRFHLERIRLLRQHYAVVFDASHAWLNALDRFFSEFPDMKVIGLHRETQTCVQSFLNRKGTGKGSPNHWAVTGNGIWSTSPGDPCYPSYAVPASLVSDPDAAKRAMITRYVTEYNQALHEIAAAHADRVLLVRTEDLNSDETYARMSRFLGFELPRPATSLNVGSSADSDKLDLAY